VNKKLQIHVIWVESVFELFLYIFSWFEKNISNVYSKNFQVRATAES